MSEEIRAKDIVPHKTSFSAGDGFYGDGDTSFFMEANELKKLTAQNALAGNVAPAFDPNRTSVNPYNAGESVVYDGKIYTFKVDHYGAWNIEDVKDGVKVFESINDRALKNYVGTSTPNLSIPVNLEQGSYSFGRPISRADRVRSSRFIKLTVDKIYSLSVDSPYKVACQFFDVNGVYLDDADFSQSHEFIAKYPNLLVIFMATDGSNIFPADIRNANFSIIGNLSVEDNNSGKNWLYETFGGIVSNVYFEQGSFASDSVDPVVSDYRLRSSSLVDLVIGTRYRVSVSSGYKVSLRFCDSYGNYHDFIGFNQSHEFVASFAKAAFLIGVSGTYPLGATISLGDLPKVGFSIVAIENEKKTCESYFVNKLMEKELVGISIIVDFEQGSYSSGSPVWLLNRCRSIRAVDLVVGEVYKVIVSNEYAVTGQFLDNDGVYRDYLGDFSSGYEFTAAYPKLLFNVKRIDDANFSPNDFKPYSFLFYKKETNQSGVDVPSRFFGLKANVLGDSITEGLGVGSSKSWVETFKNKLGLSVCRNYGISGSTIAAVSNPMSTRFSSMDDDADLIIVLGSRNDYASDVPLGTSSDSTNATFYGAMNILVEGLWSKYPTKTIVFATMFKAMKVREGSSYNEDSNPNGVGASQDDYNDIIRDVCKAHAIPVVDLYYSGTFNSWNDGMKTAFFQDTVHPNIAGHEFFGTLMASKISCL